MKKRTYFTEMIPWRCRIEIDRRCIYYIYSHSTANERDEWVSLYQWNIREHAQNTPGTAYNQEED